MKFCIVVGTRPEIIKMAPLIRECQRRKINFFILHSGQHYDLNMDAIFFEEIELPKPKYNLGIGSQPYRKQVGQMIQGMTKIFLKEQPDVVIVQGDTITVLTAALAAKKLDIAVAHHEAGLRSYDLTMPEETNRIITDHISEYLFAPTDDALKNIQEEGLNAKYYSKSGNAIVDAVRQNIALADKKASIVAKLGLCPKKYFLVTAHRTENTDKQARIGGIISGLARIKKLYPKFDIIFPLHPRTRKKIREFKLKLPTGIKIIEPVGFLEFLQLEKNAALCISDSGGVQEECSILHVPCVTLRDNTERPETVKAGMNVLAGTDPTMIANAVKKMLHKKIVWKPVFGDGHAAERIIGELITQTKKRKSLKERAKWVMRLAKKNLKLS
jgi:UDP-N-acetylglucosamine 2-epimerase (non-hydrolysing)